jgi:hypothetical protein
MNEILAFALTAAAAATAAGVVPSIFDQQYVYQGIHLPVHISKNEERILRIYGGGDVMCTFVLRQLDFMTILYYVGQYSVQDSSSERANLESNIAALTEEIAAEIKRIEGVEAAVLETKASSLSPEDCKEEISYLRAKEERLLCSKERLQEERAALQAERQELQKWLRTNVINVGQRHDLSASYIRSIIAKKSTEINSLADLRRVLCEPLPGNIFVRPGAFPLSWATDVMPFVESSNENMDGLCRWILHCLDLPFTRGSEMECTVLSHELTGSFWTYLDSLTNILALQTGMNLVDSSGATSKQLRPDFWLYVQGAMLFKAELKVDSSDLGKASEELVQKMSAWNPLALSDLPLLPCYAAAGNLLRFYAVQPPCRPGTLLTVNPVSEIFDMSKPVCRLGILRISLNMLRVFLSLRKRLPFDIPRLYFRIPRGRDGSFVEVLDDCVRKKCFPAPRAVYDCLSLSSPLPCAVTIIASRSNEERMVTLIIRPVCLQVLPASEDELRVAIRCVLTALQAFHARGFVHRDVRWANVLKSLHGWLLADFELADTVGAELPEDAISPDFLPPEYVLGTTMKYDFSGDLYCVGKMLADWESDAHIPLSDRARVLQARLMAADPASRPFAAQLLSESSSWLSHDPAAARVGGGTDTCASSGGSDSMKEVGEEGARLHLTPVFGP